MRTARYLVAAMLALFVAAPLALGEGPAKIPAKALEAMSFFVGTWEGETFEDGVKIGTDRDRRKWSAGKHCITMEGSGVEAGAEIRYSGISGWDAKGEQLVEHWFGDSGLYVAVRYPLRGMTPQLWKGTTLVVSGDGTQIDGKCELEKTDDGFVWTLRWQQDGKEHVRKSVARRVRPKQ